MTTIYSLLILESFFITFFLLLVLHPIAKKLGHTDKPSSRKRHSGDVPLIGGLSIYFCILILFYWLPIKNYAYLVSASLIVACGVIDDKRELSAKFRLFVEFLAAIIMIKWGGVEINDLGNIFGLGNVSLGYFSSAFTIFAIIGGINAFNMLDGIDGLAGTLSLLVFILILIISLNAPEIATYCLLFIPAISAFLLFNLRIFGRKKASIFLGDTGSMLFGFTIACLIINASQGENNIISPITVLWIIAIPLFDSISIMIRRIRKGKSPFAPDREHFHHILLLAGYSVNQTVGIILLVAFSAGSFGILCDLLLDAPDWLMFYIFLSLFYLYYWGMTHSWKMMKIARYLLEHKNDRRQSQRRKNDTTYSNKNRRILLTRRIGKDRRYHDIENELYKDRRHKFNFFIKSDK
ncbi:MAG: UDP-N-acetylglucosamine--undecaprenyl-phosphate N-acetylglucosaminephosphotransferase [Methylococcales bacterium]|nr:UDP-N-acetylglucosamine--undecaprenyl-phosphate N-acetylglucosaminephosphotransferase [Methylococcales bacterium]